MNQRAAWTTEMKAACNLKHAAIFLQLDYENPESLKTGAVIPGVLYALTPDQSRALIEMLQTQLARLESGGAPDAPK
jgi:hypothetical protein